MADMKRRKILTGASVAALLSCSSGVLAREPDLKPVSVARGLDHPWGLAFLSDGRMLVTERPGRMRIVERDGRLGAPLAGLPAVAASGQGGLLDVVLHPKFADNRLVYWSYSEPGDGGAGTAVARGRLDGARLADVQVVFRQVPKVSGGNHFGSRLVFARDGRLFVTLGDRFHRKDDAQTLDNHLGKIVRIEDDGRVPADNPFVARAGARPEIWSYGHRNVQGAALHPVTGELWTTEHGPQAATSSTCPRPAPTTAGRSSPTAATTARAPVSATPPSVPTWPPRCATGFRCRWRRQAWRSSPATAMALGGRASSSWARCVPRSWCGWNSTAAAWWASTRCWVTGARASATCARARTAGCMC